MGPHPPSATAEVYVRIFSEYESIHLLVYASERPLSVRKVYPVFHQEYVVVKGCGNFPLALCFASGILCTADPRWTLRSGTRAGLVDQCRCSLEEGSWIRRFVNSVLRIVDLSFVSVGDLGMRVTLRR